MRTIQVRGALGWAGLGRALFEDKAQRTCVGFWGSVDERRLVLEVGHLIPSFNWLGSEEVACLFEPLLGLD